MVDKRFFPDGNIAGWFAPLNYAKNPAQPTIAEATAATVIPLTRATSFTDTDFGADASNTSTDQSWADASAVTERGAAQFGGTWSFYYPEHYWEKSSEYAAVFEALGEARTEGYIITRVDGTFSGKAATTALAAGQAVNIYKVMTTAYSPQITGETSFRQNITFSARGAIYYNRILGTTNTPTIELAGPTTLTVGGHGLARTTISGRIMFGAANLTSSDSSVVSVTPNGVLTGVAAGTATITASDPYTTATGTLSVTVS